MKIVGKQNHSEFELNPQLAWQRGKVLDAMLSTALVPHPKRRLAADAFANERHGSQAQPGTGRYYQQALI